MVDQNAQEKIYQVALSNVKGIAHVLAQRLVAHFGSARAVFHSSYKELVKVPGTGHNLARAILSKHTVPQAEKLLSDHDRAGVRIITFWDNAYPERLRHIPDAPNLLYFRGSMDFNTTNVKFVSIVGTRRATSYGKKVIEALLSELSGYPLAIVSGLAYGVDVHAHKTALELNIPTLAVVAGCIKKVYPSVHKKIAQEILTQGGLASEYPLHTPLEAHQFVVRNRIIAGISDATIVVEAGQKSGALITASWANEYSRDVFAVSGGIYDAYSAGCHHLIKTHQASLLTSAADIVNSMNWDQSNPSKTNSSSISKRFTDLTKVEQSAVSAMGGLQKEVFLEELSQYVQIPMNLLLTTMLSLEMKKIVKILPGRKLRLTAY